MSREHIVANWVGKVIPRTQPGHFLTYRYNDQAVKLLGIEKLPEGYVSGDLWAQRARCVCGNCNNGWLSVMQEQCKDFIPDLIQGRRRALTADEVSLLALWCCHLAIMNDHTKGAFSAISQSQRTSVYEKREPSAEFSIWVGTYVGSQWLRRISHSAGLSGHLEEGICRIQGTTFAIGKLFGLVISETYPCFNWPDFIGSGLTKIWPSPPDTLSFPHFLGIKDEGRFCADSLATLVSRSMLHAQSLGIQDFPWEAFLQTENQNGT